MEKEWKNPPEESPLDKYHPIEGWIEEEEEEGEVKKGQGALIALSIFLACCLLFIAAVIIPTFPGRQYLPLPAEEVLKKELTKSNKEIDTLKSTLAEADKLKSSLGESKKAVSSLSSNIGDLRNRVISLKGQLDEKEGKIGSLTKELRGLRAERENLSNQVSQLRKGLSSQEEEILNLKKKIADEEKKVNSLTAELERAKKEAEDLAAELENRETLFNRKARQDEEAVAAILENAKRITERAENAEATLEKQKKEIKNLKAQLLSLKAELERVEVLSDDVVPPEPVSMVAPNYPAKAARDKLEDTVYLRVLISEDGEVLKAKVARLSHPGHDFEKEALKVIKKWRFTPAIKKGKRVMIWKEIAIKFRVIDREKN
jgi:TonB family protein